MSRFHRYRADRTNSHAGTATDAGMFVEVRQEGSAEARLEPDRVLGTALAARLAGDVAFRETDIGYRCEMIEAESALRQEDGFRAGQPAFAAEGAFGRGEIEQGSRIR
ncbi:hypothetical protein QO002_006072 [Pararhizobium capsulatum DSM 1112]|uniref:Uncharacterized protein n=1 Tax=Pararhizobium capsulatum DSM 1112 TaxID=1121113 RepID=A0ABU0C023_9HYPH|nr:hypothetical protein [Pararhizobium capsulatum DSM 1112]